MRSKPQETLETSSAPMGEVLGDYVRYLCSREKLNAVTQADIARACKVSQQTASNLTLGCGWKDSYIDIVSSFFKMAVPTFVCAAYRYHHAVERSKGGQPIDPTA